MGQALVVGLTGGVASGKSTVEAAFRALGVPVVDADQVARQVVEAGQPALQEIVARFGDDILQPDGTLDRRALRQIVFADAQARRDLEAITHPHIRAALQAWKEGLEAPYGMLSAAILIEAGLNGLCDRVLVVDAPESSQRARLIARDGTSETLAQQMLDAQLPRQKRLQHADDVLSNDGAETVIPETVARLHAHYLALARGEADAGQRLRLP